MYKPRGGKLLMGPLWDYDLAAGNANYANAFQTQAGNPQCALVLAPVPGPGLRGARATGVERDQGRPTARDVPSITSGSATLQQAQLNNFECRPILETYVWPNNTIPGSYAGEINYLNGWLTARTAWIDGQMNP